MSQDRRNWHGNEPGILRKKDETDTELLVFGYSCKLFRDDEKALLIDQGKHLIPWMGDETLKIDRYDVRGALFDISKYEANSTDSNMAWDALTNDERKVELMCDEERYRAMFHNEDEEALYQEEELKRLHQALGSDKEYGQVAYQYEDKLADNSSNLMDEEANSDDQQEPFIPPAQLDIPPNMTIPETKKQNAIIEKTALFINQQGPQMEILLKMKQASNPQFEFLSITCPLHSYYRHVLAVIKTGRYKPSLPNNDKHSRHSDDDHYLHPSLLPAPSTLELAPSIPSISYRPSADCTYSMLVDSIKRKQEGNLTNSNTTTKGVDDSKEIFGAPVKYTPTKVTDILDDDKTANRVVKLVSRSNKRRRRRRHHHQSDSPSNGQSSKSVNQQLNLLNYDKTILPSIVDSTVSVSQELESSIEVPPVELQVIIDKMASYVVKNGIEFEAIVRNKGDPRFSFLNFGNQYRKYYELKVNYYEDQKKPVSSQISSDLPPSVYSIENNDSFSEEEIEESQDATSSPKDLNVISEDKSTFLFSSTTNDSDDDTYSKPKVKVTKLQESSDNENHSSNNKPVPVCFSIKKPKEADKLELCSALPVEETSDEDEETEDDSRPQTESVERTNHTRGEDKKYRKHVSTDKWAEERVKDKLVQAAKEKVCKKEKEKQLQLERKKRALAFLNLLQKDNPSPVNKKLGNGRRFREGSESRQPSNPSSIVTLSSDDSTDDDDTRNCRLSYEASLNSARDKAQSSQTLQRILDAVPKDRYHRRKKSHHRSPSHNHSYIKSGSEMSSRHSHLKNHKKHHRPREKETVHKPSHKRKHKSKSSKSHKRRRKSGSVNLSSSD